VYHERKIGLARLAPPSKRIAAIIRANPEKGIRAGELSKLTGISTGTIRKTLHRLVKVGAISRPEIGVYKLRDETLTLKIRTGEARPTPRATPFPVPQPPPPPRLDRRRATLHNIRTVPGVALSEGAWARVRGIATPPPARIEGPGPTMAAPDGHLDGQHQREDQEDQPNPDKGFGDMGGPGHTSLGS